MKKRVHVQHELEIINRKLKLLSELDELARILNRRKFIELIHNQWNNSRIHQSYISLLMQGIDKFKDYNDNYGHLAEDTILVNH